MDQTVADQARSAPIIGQAEALAGWLGEEKRKLTPGGVLRRPDVPAAGEALGITVPAKIRTAADIRELHRPWAFGTGAGLIRVAGGQAAAEADLDPVAIGDDDLLERFLAGLRALFAAEEPKDSRGDGILVLVLTVLGLLDGAIIVEGLPSGLDFWRVVSTSAFTVAERYSKSFQAASSALYDNQPGVATLLTECGLAVGETDDLAITDLGRWVRHRLVEGLPVAVDPGVPAATMIAEAARFTEDRVRAHVTSDWLHTRDPVAAVREILRAADTMRSSERIVATRLAQTVPGDPLPAWREMTAMANVGPHARLVLWQWSELEELPETDVRWLAVERASDEIAKGTPDEALTTLWLFLPGETAEECIANLTGTGHPEADEVARAVTAFLASDAPRTIDQAIQLKVTLKWHDTWRRVLMPAADTLADLHNAIQILFGWDGDHLHVFTIGKDHYSGAFYHLEETRNDHEARLGTVLRNVKKFEYEYDLGASWIHEITVEKTLPVDEKRSYPVCTAFSGDNPVEYPDFDDEDGDEEDPVPFDLDDVNRRLLGED